MSGRGDSRRARTLDVRGLGKMPADMYVHHAEKCAGKVDYGSRGKAKRVAKRASARYGVHFREYFCPICLKWHLTTHGLNTVAGRQGGGKWGAR